MKASTLKKFISLHRNFGFDEPLEGISLNDEKTIRKDKCGRIIVPLYSQFFSSLTNDMLYTNNMFEDLKREITMSISAYSPKEKIHLSIYESSKVDDDIRESALIGFKRYISIYYKKMIAFTQKYLFSFLILAFVGIISIYLVHNVFSNLLSEWIRYLLDIISTVFVWEFVSYLAFEFPKSISDIARLKQILQIEYTFRHWE